ncbi:MAG: 2-C-methyl-D-erythritol 2,4-cyclodiphosphate synthase, partial [candidate division WOR-3 bacterium]
VDTMILAQAPRLAPFLPAMRVQLAATLQVDPGQVNLKATTQEGLDAVGREEGIACYAVATIQRL